MIVQRFESLFLETPPWVEGDRFDPDLGFCVSVAELPIAMTTLDDAFLDALDEIDRNRDSLSCWRCGEGVGWVLMQRGDVEVLDWVSLALVRELTADLPPAATVPARPMCGSCAPYVDPESYRDKLRALMRDA